MCEPQLGKRGLYPTLSNKKSSEKTKVMMNFLSLCDGEHSLLDIADKINVPARDLYELVEKLVLHDLISIATNKH